MNTYKRNLNPIVMKYTKTVNDFLHLQQCRENRMTCDEPMSNIKWYYTIGSTNIVIWHLNNFNLIYTRLMFSRIWAFKLDLQSYHIKVCWNTELLYWVIQLLRKHNVVYCLSLLMLSLWCYFNVHFQSFSESSSC